MPNTKSVGVAFSDPALSGGTIDNTPIGATTKSTGAFTTLTATGATTLAALSTTGTTILGDGAGDLVGFYGGAGTAQGTFVSTQSINAISVSGVVGFTSSTSLSSFVGKLNAISAVLVALGLLAAS